MVARVLVVDDEPEIRELCRVNLELEGFEVLEAGDGEEALRVAGETSPNVVLLDVNMPGMDGFEVASRLSSDPSAPAVILTSSRDGADFDQRIRESGARGFIPKAEISGPRLAALLQ